MVFLSMAQPSPFSPGSGASASGFAPSTFEAAQRGDARALSAVIRPLGPAVLSAARRILGANNPEAEDVAQESLVAVAGAIHRIQDEGALERYATRTTIRKAVRLRQKNSRRRQSDHWLRAPEPSESPDDETLRRRQLGALVDLLSELPEPQSEALVMRLALDRSLDEIARTLEVPANTIRSRVRLGREALKKKIDKRPKLRALLEL